MYKAIFIDIDGTLKDSNGNISDIVIGEIEKIQSMGIQVVLCSGRSKEDTIKYSEQCKASKYVITLNGAEIWDYENLISIFKLCLPEKVVKELEEKMRRLGVEFIVSTTSKTDESHKRNILQCRIKLLDFDKIDEIRDILHKLENININELMRKSNIVTLNSNEADQIDFFITNSETNKWRAIEEFCRLKGIRTSEVIAIGDGSNDIEMIKNAGIGVAMENATEKVKSYATLVIPSNDKHGVAIFLKELRRRINLRKKSSEKGERENG